MDCMGEEEEEREGVTPFEDQLLLFLSLGRSQSITLVH